MKTFLIATNFLVGISIGPVGIFNLLVAGFLAGYAFSQWVDTGHVTEL